MPIKAAFERARRALDFLESHRLDPSVPHYELALGFITHPSSEMAQDIRAQTDGGVRLTGDMVATLAERHMAHRSVAAIGERERTVTRQTEELGTLTSGAHDLTSALERDVGSIVARSDGRPEEAGDFLARLAGAERDLAQLRGEVAKLQSEVTNGDRRRGDGDHDELTQALNQHGAHRVLDQISGYDRNYVMMMFSVDHLIALNERFGRPVGDNVLNAFASTLRQVFPEQELIRWTGNEFIVVMKDTVLTTARVLADDALTALEARRLKLRGSGEWIGVVTASAGVVLAQGEAAMAVLDRARANMLTAAAGGGNRIEG